MNQALGKVTSFEDSDKLTTDRKVIKFALDLAMAYLAGPTVAGVT
jgi:hypothetical protein